MKESILPKWSISFHHIMKKLLKKLERKLKEDVHGIHARGMYENQEKMMLLCVATRNEVEQIKRIAIHQDRYAFVIITNAREVRGKGFKKPE